MVPYLCPELLFVCFQELVDTSVGCLGQLGISQLSVVITIIKIVRVATTPPPIPKPSGKNCRRRSRLEAADGDNGHKGPYARYQDWYDGAE